MDQYEEIELREILLMLKRHIKLIAVIPLVTMLTAVIISIFVIQPPVPMYSSETTVLVNMKVPGSESVIIDDSLLNLNKKLIPTYLELINSRNIKEKVDSLIKEKTGYINKTSRVLVEQVKDTDLIKIIVTNKNPERAALYANTVAQVFADEIQNMMNIDNVKIVDEALIPAEPINLGTKKITLNVAIAGIVGLMSAIVLVFLIEFFINTLKRPEDIKRELNLPVLGTIKCKNSEEIVTLTTPEGSSAEAYRILTANLQYGFGEKQIKKILITSSSSNEVKNTVAANLAVALAQAGYSVALLDCNFKAPKLHKIFDIKNTIGFADVIIDNKPLDTVLQETEVEGLKVITTGPSPSNTSRMLSAKYTKVFLKELTKLADYVIIDSPDVLTTADVAILTTFCDGVLLTIDAGKTKIDEAKKAKDSLEAVRASILGTVFSEVSA